MTSATRIGTDIDQVKGHPEAYKPRAKPALVTLGSATYLTFDGTGLPAMPGSRFQDAIGALYGLAYTLKFAGKAAGRGFRVAPLEGVWSLPKGADPHTAPISQWRWKLRLRIPDDVGADAVAAARALLAERGKAGAFDDVRREVIADGDCITVLHVGPYAAEGPTIERLRAFAESLGRKPTGAHHEIYLSDPQRVPPERLRTIVRLPLR